MNHLINNAWVISLASIAITIVVTALWKRTSEWIQARHGDLTGTYLALSQEGGTPVRVVAEVVDCRHIGENLKGSITALAHLALGTTQAVVNYFAPHNADYSFTGRIQERQALINYWGNEKASQNGGTMTMRLDDTGRALRGIWSGAASNGQIINGPCMWIKTEVDIQGMSAAQCSQYIDYLLHTTENPWNIDLSREYDIKTLPPGRPPWL
jgi:hypothetical protein